jgi:hypothetical protein
MSKLKSKEHSKRSATEIALRRAKLSGKSLLRAEDLKGATPAAASKALARLAKQGVLTRVGKGLYFAPKDTLIGKSKPSETSIALKRLEGKTRPTGASAANILGLSTQVPARPQIVALTSNPPKSTGAARIRFRRNASPQPLPALEGALLEFIRERGATAEMGPNESLGKLRELLTSQLPANRLRGLREAALAEPPRVRAILGALFAYAELTESLWEPLKTSLNPLTRFDFGLFSQLPNAREWQAKVKPGKTGSCSYSG